MVATQTRLMAEHHDARTAEATEAAIALEKRTAQKEKVEADIVGLILEKTALMESMAELRREQAELSAQTKRLSREVGKLETALSIRQQEMRDMNSRAETLERRILEGMMMNVRSAKASTRAGGPRVEKKRMSPQERDASMSLKRVPSTASTVTTKTSVKDGATSIGGAVGAVLKKSRTPLTTTANGGGSTRVSAVDRRILSTSVMGNRGSLRGSINERAMVLAPAPKFDGFVSLKRSQSVKSASGLSGRKGSWGGVVSLGHVDDKENQHQAENGDENRTSDLDEPIDDDVSDAGTERRTSTLSMSSGVTGTSYMYTDSLAYGTGSDLSTRSGRTVSYTSSIGGTVNGQTESIAEEDEVNEEGGAGGQGIVLAQPETALEAGQGNSMAMTVMEDDFETPVNEEAFDDAVEHDNAPDQVLEPEVLHQHGQPEGVATPLETATFDFAVPPLITDQGTKYDGVNSQVHGSDSGLGTEPPTALEGPGGLPTGMGQEGKGEALEYFVMSEEEMKGR